MGRQTHRPHAPARPARFTVGRDRHGWWVVQDRLGKVGGLFASEDAAMHFARNESSHDAADICRIPEGTVIELDSPARRSRHPRQARIAQAPARNRSRI